MMNHDDLPPELENLADYGVSETEACESELLLGVNSFPPNGCDRRLYCIVLYCIVL